MLTSLHITATYMDNVIHKETHADIGADLVIKTHQKIKKTDLDSATGLGVNIIPITTMTIQAGLAEKTLSLRLQSLPQGLLDVSRLKLCSTNQCNHSIQRGEIWLEKPIFNEHQVNPGDKITILNQTFIVKGYVKNQPKYGQSYFLTYNNAHIHPDDFITLKLNKKRLFNQNYYMVFGEHASLWLMSLQTPIAGLYQQGSAFIDHGTHTGRDLLSMLNVSIIIMIILSTFALSHSWQQRYQLTMKTLTALGIPLYRSKFSLLITSFLNVSFPILLASFLAALLTPWVINSVTIIHEIMPVNELLQATAESFIAMMSLTLICLMLSLYLGTLQATSIIVAVTIAFASLQLSWLKIKLLAGMGYAFIFVSITFAILYAILTLWLKLASQNNLHYVVIGRIKAYRTMHVLQLGLIAWLFGTTFALLLQGIDTLSTYQTHYQSTEKPKAIVVGIQPDEYAGFLEKVKPYTENVDRVELTRAKLIGINGSKIPSKKIDIIKVDSLVNLITQQTSTKKKVQVDNIVAKHYQITPGETLTIRQLMSSNIQELPVEKIIHGYTDLFNLSSDKLYLFHQGTHPLSGISALQLNMDIEQLNREVIRQHYPQAQTFDIKKVMQKLQETLHNSFNILLYFLFLIVSFICLNCYHLTRWQRLQRTVDEQILSYLGLSTHQLTSLSNKEKLVLLRISFLSIFAATYYMSTLFITVLNRMDTGIYLWLIALIPIIEGSYLIKHRKQRQY